MNIKNPLQLLKQTDLMALFGVTDRTIQLWHAKGLPRTGEGRGCTYAWAQVLPWYVAYISGSGKDDRGVSDRDRLVRAQANLAEMELAERAGLLVRTEDVRASAEEVLSRVRAKLLAIPNRVAGRMTGEETREQRQELLRDEVHQALAELAAMADEEA